MSTLPHPSLQSVVTAPKHWGGKLLYEFLLAQFDYVIEVSEHESMEWRDAAGGFVPVLGGWFCVVMRQPAEAGDYFPSEWETETFRLPGRLNGSPFDHGDLARMLSLAEAANGEFILMGYSSIIVFRPGPLWLPRREPGAGVATHSSRGAA